MRTWLPAPDSRCWPHRECALELQQHIWLHVLVQIAGGVVARPWGVVARVEQQWSRGTGMLMCGSKRDHDGQCSVRYAPAWHTAFTPEGGLHRVCWRMKGRQQGCEHSPTGSTSVRQPWNWAGEQGPTPVPFRYLQANTPLAPFHGQAPAVWCGYKQFVLHEHECIPRSSGSFTATGAAWSMLHPTAQNRQCNSQLCQGCQAANQVTARHRHQCCQRVAPQVQRPHAAAPGRGHIPPRQHASWQRQVHIRRLHAAT